MIKTLLGLSLVFALSAAALAQKVDSKSKTSTTNNTTVSKEDKNISIASGTQIAAELQNSLNVQRSKIGDEVVLKTKKAIKQNGQVVVEKGSKLVGRVTEVQERTKDSASSRIGVLFDTLVQNGQQIPIDVVITSVLQTAAQTRVNSDDGFGDMSATSSSRTSSQTSTSSGGVLSGVTNTASGVLNTTTQTVGSVANTTGQTVGSTTRALGSNIRGLQISQSADASAGGSSTLTLNTGNLKLEKGTTFNLSVSESGSVGSTANKQPEK